MNRFVCVKRAIRIGGITVATVALGLPVLPSVPLAGAHPHFAAAAQTAQAAVATQEPHGAQTPQGPQTPGAGTENRGAPRVTEPQPPSAPVPNPPPAPTPSPATPNQDKPWPRSAKLRIHVIDGRTMKPLSGAEVVVIESEQRLRTSQDGYTPWFDAPLIRDPRYRPLVQELHGQLGVIVYKNGYRDSIHLGIRLNPGVESETTVWMYQLGPGDVRIEPVLYQVPFHHLWLIRLADRYRDSSQMGEGFQRP